MPCRANGHYFPNVIHQVGSPIPWDHHATNTAYLVVFGETPQVGGLHLQQIMNGCLTNANHGATVDRFDEILERHTLLCPRQMLVVEEKGRPQNHRNHIIEEVLKQLFKRYSPSNL